VNDWGGAGSASELLDSGDMFSNADTLAFPE